MFSEKNIPKLIVLTPVLTVVLVAFFVAYFFIQNQYNYFEEESKRIESEYLVKQKELLKKEVNSVISYIDFHKQTLQRKQLIQYIETIRYEDNGYIWIHDTGFVLVAHPFRKESIGKYDKSLQDAQGRYIIQMFVQSANKSVDGSYIEYSWAKPNEKHFSTKLGFVKLYEPFGWVIGSGVYMDDIEKFIAQSKKALEIRIQRYIILVVVISLIGIFFIGAISFVIASKTSEAFTRYNEEKDRALLHQSRLARMGVMISMIAHQWRQPLTQLSSLLMEVETAKRFEKLDDAKLEDSLRESGKLIEFMSETIDDFRNFFKPDKEAKQFDIDTACQDASNLIEATLLNQGIILQKKFHSDAKVFGYQREFSQVIINLLTNAKDILLERSTKNPQIVLETKCENLDIVVCVKDNAGGIEDEHFEHIFEPYFTTKPSTQGSGLGLYISKMIIEKNMQGELSCINTKEGAQFIIRLNNGR